CERCSRKGKRKVPFEEEGRRRLLAQGECCVVLPAAEVCLLCAFALHILSPASCPSSLPSRESYQYSFSCLSLSLITGARPFDKARPLSCDAAIEQARPQESW
ncbi:unnamed protein product, partial [Ascophyllum nodosum]